MRSWRCLHLFDRRKFLSFRYGRFRDLGLVSRETLSICNLCVLPKDVMNELTNQNPLGWIGVLSCAYT